MDEKEDLLPEIWPEAPESSIQGLGLPMNWEMQAVEKHGTDEDDTWLLDFSDLSFKYSWYSSSENLDYGFSDLDTYATFSGKPCNE